MFFGFWVANIYYDLLVNFEGIFLVNVAIGGLLGSSYLNFLYLANANFDEHLNVDMGLHFYERELTVNLLLIASDMAKLLALWVSFWLKITV